MARAAEARVAAELDTAPRAAAGADAGRTAGTEPGTGFAAVVGTELKSPDSPRPCRSTTAIMRAAT